MTRALRRVLRRLERACLSFLVKLLDPFIERVKRARGDRPTVYGDSSRLVVASSVQLNDATLNTRSGCITIEEDAFFGHQVMVLTGRHAIDRFGQERQNTVAPDGLDVAIRRGAWIASRAIIIGPCEIGRHAVVAAGSVVTNSVPAYAIVAGAPARVIGTVGGPAVEVSA